MNLSVSQQFERFKENGRLPTPRGVALEIIRLADKEHITTQEIARLIDNDRALSERIVSVANLLARRDGGNIETVLDAVTAQGVKSVRQLALGLSLVDDFRTGACRDFDYQEFWTHSVCTGIAAQRIVADLQVGIADEAFMVGLLSRIGQLALATLFDQEYSQLLARKAGNLDQLEREAFGIDHAQMTALMLADWGMPELFQQIALHLDRPAGSGFVEGERGWMLMQLFHFSDRLAQVCTQSASERVRQIPRLMLLATRIGIETDALIEIGDYVLDGLQEWSALLGNRAPQCCRFEQMLSTASIGPELTGIDALPGEHGIALNILLVEDDTTTCMLYKTFLEKSGHRVRTAGNGREALEIVRKNPPQLIISDWRMPEMDGIEFCRMLRENPLWRGIYVFIVTALESTENLIEAFEAGANDYLVKPINPRVLAARLRSAQLILKLQQDHEQDRLQLRQFADELAQSNKRLQELALTDALTGLPNRRAGMARLEQEWAVAMRGGRTLCCMMVDIDHFKSVNDSYGHLVGDEALKLVAKSLQQAARKQDIVCRLGGEEFMVICPDTDAHAGFLYAERLRHSIASRPLAVCDQTLSLEVSIGLADSAGHGDEQAMLHRSDVRLYAAKTAGRNRTVADDRQAGMVPGKNNQTGTQS